MPPPQGSRGLDENSGGDDSKQARVGGQATEPQGMDLAETKDDSAEKKGESQLGDDEKITPFSTNLEGTPYIPPLPETDDTI